MKKVLRALVVLLAVVAALALTPQSAQATSKTSDEAIAWLKSQVGNYIDMDGAPQDWLYQCVDLTKAYYQFLGESPVRGNGQDYSWNDLPSGWIRIPGG